MSFEGWVMRVYNSNGDLWARIHGNEEGLREQGVGLTTNHRQKMWRCDLYREGRRVAFCRRGVWEDMKP